MLRSLVVAALTCSLLAACALLRPAGGSREEVPEFLEKYTAGWLERQAAAAEAEWALNTHIVDGDESNTRRYEEAAGDLARFEGAVETIDKTRGFLEGTGPLAALDQRQLDRVLYLAASSPQTVAALVAKKIEAEATQVEALFGFDFQIDGHPVSANEIDRILAENWDEDQRLAAWVASKEVGKELKQGLADLVRLRNGCVQALGYHDFFEYEVSDYGMEVGEMMAMNRRFLQELRPLYRELHTWARYTLAERFGEPVPDLLPAHWLPNRWGQSWMDLVRVEGFDLDAALADKNPEWLVRQAERFYVSLGFETLPQGFWEKSSLYPLPADTPWKKNNHASAWHMDLDRDVRSLMSVEATPRWYETTHHELGHIYYYLEYSTPEVPPLLREGANRAFHEAIGSLLGFASMQQGFLQGLGLVATDAEVDRIQALLKEALDFVVFIPFGSGTMTHFERDLYATDLSIGEYNERWWEYVRTFQGIAPPAPRGEEYCDAATKTHVNNDPAQYYDYALSQVMLHQFHAHIARNILGQPPSNTNYFGSPEVGEFLHGILKLGATRDWREVMQESLGQQVSARPALEYFAPLLDYLQAQNQGRTHTLPEI